MDRLCLWLPAMLLLTAPGSVRAQDRVVYFAVGESLVMSPPEAVPGVTSILWKFNGNLVAEWVKDKVPLEYYSQFRGRTTVDTGNGLLTISSMTAADVGRYSVETNNKMQRVGYDAKVLKKVPKPTVEIKPPGCNRTSPDCYLTCDGDTTGAEPVTYSWKRDCEDWKRSERRINIINSEEIQSVKIFSCRMKNPVSEESEPVDNPFFQRRLSSSRHWSEVLLNVMKSLAVFVLLVAVVYLLCQKPGTVCPCTRGKAGDNAAQSGNL
ncbi:hypothetical protein Q5P01_021859 [Channa striata]|uniref:Ig-like domain-containing protein n=1 Tax=Channa striata TaxID=64152 RepID=A0AA88LUV2_CHASR|nr:hypothetical protein Q5P01_021859 [Channa striata]